MAEYSLENGAVDDIENIGDYSARNWGRDQAVRYLSGLEDHFGLIAIGAAAEKTVFDHRVDIRVSRYQHHYIFFVREDGEDLVVLAVLHEKMDLIERLGERLKD